MDGINDKLLDHQRRWNIAPNDEDSLGEFKARLQAGMNRESFFHFVVDHHAVAQVLSHTWAVPIDPPSTSQVRHGQQVLEQLFDDQFKGANTQYDLSRVFGDLASALEVIDNEANKHAVHILIRIIETCTVLTPSVGFEVARTDRGVILYPPGAEILDREVVNSSLAWLSNAPEAQQAFSQALHLYQDGDKENYRAILDNLRFSVEQLLKGVLRNRKSLENQEKLLLKWLSERATHKATRNLFVAMLFGPYSQFHNDAVKHASEYSELEVEFMIYLSATFMRHILVIDSGERP